MEIIITMNKNEENKVLNIVSDMIEKRACVTESKTYSGKWGAIVISPTAEELIINASFEPSRVINTIELTADLFKDIKVWLTKYTEDLMTFCDKWGNKLKRVEDYDVEEEENN